MPNYDATITFYKTFIEKQGKEINLATDTLKILLTTSSYTPNLDTHTQYSDITNEVSGNGYAQQTLASVTYSRSGSVATLSFSNATFTASGGSITARRWVIYNDTTATKYLIATGLLDDANADVVASSGNSIVFTAASGLFTLTDVTP